MKKITLLIVLLLAFDFGYGQTKIAELTFETTGGYTTNDPEFTDNGNDYFFRTDGSNMATNITYGNLQGSYYFGAQDTYDTSLVLPLTLLINDIDITGYTNLEFRVHLAEDESADGNEDWDITDFVHFNYDINNSGAFKGLLWIENDGSPFNSPAYIDNNFDGDGDGTEITDTFTQFTNNIIGSGDLLDIQIVIRLEAADEDIAIDNIEIWGVALPCPTTTTWTAGAWDNGVPNSSINAVITDNFDTSVGGAESSFSACSLLVNTGSTLTVNNNGYLEIENNVTIDGTLVVETQGNFVQRDDAGTFTNNGTSSVDKTTASKQAWYFYTYWSSPVVGETTSNVFPDVDGDRRFWFDAASFVDTDGDDIDDNADDWQYALASNGTDNMLPGVGYAVTEARLFMAPGSGSATFEGEFNTGDVSTNIDLNALNTGTNWNFIGNPYPSAIDFDAFYTANSGVVDGTAYFWSQATPPSEANPGNENSNFSRNDYAMYTAGSGGIGVSGASGNIPSQYIPSGQGFFIAGLTTGTATFTNAMRMADATSNTLFFKNTNSKKNSNNIANRLWVNLTSDNGVFNQILVAYVDGATNGLDSGAYDAKRFLTPDFNATLYSTIEEDSNNKFAIQGKSTNSLNEDEIINLGFSTNIDVETLYKFSIAQLEGDFLTNNPVYVKDILLDTLHDLSASDYTFTSEVGEFNDRFEIRFSSKVLSTERVEANSNDLKIIELEDNNIQFTASKNIKTVRIFDLMGRQLYQFEGNQTSETYKLSNLSSSIYIAKVTLINGATITKKAFKK